MDDELVARSLGALSQVHRLKAFRVLVVAGKAGLTPGVLSEQLGIAAPKADAAASAPPQDPKAQLRDKLKGLLKK